MKNLLLLCFLAFLTQSCVTTSNFIPLKGKYQETPVRSKLSHSFDEVWEAAIDLLADTGQGVKMIDKSSGFIIGQVSSFFGTLTLEDVKGNLVNPNASIVVEKPRNSFVKDMFGYDSNAQWNIRIKPLTDSTTEVSVKVHSIDAKYVGSSISGESTGNFEKFIIDEINDRAD